MLVVLVHCVSLGKSVSPAFNYLHSLSVCLGKQQQDTIKMVVPSLRSDDILSSPQFFSVMLLSHFVVDGAWCASVAALPSGNVTVR